MPRKTHGEKTGYPGLSRMPDGKWMIRIVLPLPGAGKRMEREMTLAADVTQRGALMELRALRDRMLLLVPAPEPAPEPAPKPEPTRLLGLTLAACKGPWLEGKRARLRVSTMEHLEDVLTKHVLPFLGGLRVAALSRSDIERWVTQAERSKMANGQPHARETINGWWRVVKQFVRDVAADQDVRDPIIRVRPPRGPVTGRRERRTLSAEQLGRLLDAVSTVAPDRYAEIVILSHTGMRPGELYALTWSDIDEVGGRIIIERSHRRGVVAETKTGDPREVALTPTMAMLLRVHRQGMIAAQHPGLPSGLVFPSETGGFRGPESLLKPLATAAKRAGIDQRLGAQVLRRTLNTLLLLDGVDRIVLRSQMGHCSEEMTERYAGVSPEAKRAAVLRFEGRLG